MVAYPIAIKEAWGRKINLMQIPNVKSSKVELGFKRDMADLECAFFRRSPEANMQRLDRRNRLPAYEVGQMANKRSIGPNDCDVGNVRQNRGARCVGLNLSEIK